MMMVFVVTLIFIMWLGRAEIFSTDSEIDIKMMKGMVMDIGMAREKK